MRYIQDITLNHSNPNDTHVFGRLYQSMESDRILIDSYDDDIDPVSYEVLRSKLWNAN